LADIRGALGLSINEAAWIPAVGHAVAQASSFFLHSSPDRTQIIAQSGSLLGSDVGQQASSLAIGWLPVCHVFLWIDSSSGGVCAPANNAF
jgi:hypothetical protein